MLVIPKNLSSPWSIRSLIGAESSTAGATLVLLTGLTSDSSEKSVALNNNCSFLNLLICPIVLLSYWNFVLFFSHLFAMASIQNFGHDHHSLFWKRTVKIQVVTEAKKTAAPYPIYIGSPIFLQILKSL